MKNDKISEIKEVQDPDSVDSREDEYEKVKQMYITRKGLSSQHQS